MKRSSKRSLAAVFGAITLLSFGALISADGPDSRGEATGSGRAGRRNMDGRLAVDGEKLTLTFRYSARRHRRLPAVVYTGLRGDDGIARFRFAVTTGLLGALSDAVNGSEGSGSSIVEFSGPLTIANGRARLDIVGERSVTVLNQTQVRSISFDGAWTPDTTAEQPEPEVIEPEVIEPVEPRVERLALGRDAVTIAANTTYEVTVPLGGSLSLQASSGTISVTRPDGSAVELENPGAKAEIEVADDQIGAYQVSVADGSGTIRARFVQDGRIDARIRPWSSHTYYPVYKESYGRTNPDTMFVDGGPTEKFDKALNLTGAASAKNWEINGYGNRTGLGFENGHYARIATPQESNWIVDCNLNGIRSYKDDDEYVGLVDKDADGLLTRDELLAHGRVRAADRFFKTYDADGDGAVVGDEISPAFVAYYDKTPETAEGETPAEADGRLDPEEWRAALMKDYQDLLTNIATGEVDRVLEERDGDGDGQLTKAEASPSNGMDVIDLGDQDGDGREYYDRDNIVLIMKSGERIVGNRYEEADGAVTLYKGYMRDAKVGDFQRADIVRILEGAADGKFTGSYSVGWWGHCNAWALAAIMFQVPKEPITYNGVEFSVRDQKALLIALTMQTTDQSSFWWRQWNNPDSVPTALYAADFHRQLKRWLRDEQQGLMADMDLKPEREDTNFQVWNYPLLGYTAEVREADGGDPHVLEFKVEVQKGSYSDENSESSQRLSYTLHFDEQGNIRDDEGSKTDWTTQHPYRDGKGFIRYLIHPYGFTGAPGSKNPRITQEQIETIFGGPLKRNSLEALAEAEAAGE